MANLLTLGELNKHFNEVRDRLGVERQALIDGCPLPADFSRDAYGFSYLRAERIGLAIIAESLKEVAWLPVRLDPLPEVRLSDRAPLKRWLATDSAPQPDADTFGNDFIHALTRIALCSGWTGPEFRAATQRLGTLFRDLSCLIGLIYYGVWMSENGIEGVPVSDPFDLERTANEIAQLTRSPEVARLLQKRKLVEADKRARLDAAAPRGKPALHLVPATIPEAQPPA